MLSQATAPGSQLGMTKFFPVLKRTTNDGTETTPSALHQSGSSAQSEDALSDEGVQRLVEFSSPYDLSGYNDKFISDEKISDVYLHFGKTRTVECWRYLRTTSGKDNFYKIRAF